MSGLGGIMSASWVFFAVALVGLAGVTMFGQMRRQRAIKAAPRITKAEVDAFWAQIKAATLPMAKITVAKAVPKSPLQSRIGGAPFVMGEERWPLSVHDGSPMLFLAQINFAEVPPIADFPSSGLLQLFAAADARGHLENTESSEDRVLRWFPDPQGSATLSVPEAFKALKKPGSLSLRAMHDGLGLLFRAAEAAANPYNWPYDVLAPDYDGRLGETPNVQERLQGWEARVERIVDGYGTHWLGGQPKFTQSDIRAEPDLQGLNRVLLHLGFDDNICLGDAGDLNLMIRDTDLKTRDFQKAFCTWDCG